jgi:hypothetical protein
MMMTIIMNDRRAAKSKFVKQTEYRACFPSTGRFWPIPAG